ncbi:MAG: TetR-like C-terminal domain-containing protein [Faecalimonas sp.]
MSSKSKSVGTQITEHAKAFIAEFYKYGLCGNLMLDWIKHGMKEDYEEIVHDKLQDHFAREQLQIPFIILQNKGNDKKIIISLSL